MLSFSFYYIFCPNRRAISLGLYGSDPLYTLGALKNAELLPKYYPGWSVVFYIDKTVPQEIIKSLEEIVITEGKFNHTMFGRFTIADNKHFDRFIVRDVDSWPTIKRKSCGRRVDQHEEHGALVMGGLWGGKSSFLKGQKINDLISKWKNREDKQEDQNFLRDVVIPIVGIENFIAHDSYYCKVFPNSVNSPFLNQEGS